MTPEKRYYPALDMLRIAAALLVMLHHLTYGIGSIPTYDSYFVTGGHIHFPDFDSIAASGWVGVELFFMLSGFVIAASAAHTSPLQFFINRLVRLYPAIAICASLTLIALFSLQRLPISALAEGYLSMLALGPDRTLDGAYWTLKIEFSFYLLIFCLLASRLFHRLEYLAGWLIIQTLAFWVILLSSGEMSGDIIASSLYQRLLLLHGTYFGIGILLWQIRQHKLTIWRAGLIILGLIAAGLEITQTALHKAALASATPAMLPPLLIFTIGFGFIYYAVFYDRSAGSKYLRLIGLSTYPFYLLHNVFGATVIYYLTNFDLNKYAALAAAITLSAGISVATTTMIEPPLQTWLRRKLTAI